MSKTVPTISKQDEVLLLNALAKSTGTSIQRIKGYRNVCMCLCMLDAGLRVGEVTSLRCSDLFYQSEPVKSIFISASTSKNGTERSIPVSERLYKAIKELGVYYWQHYNFADYHYAFGMICKIQKPSIRSVELIIGKAATTALGQWIHPHQLRHTFATRLMRTTSIRIVQQLMGHKSITSTQVYTHPNDDDLRKAIATLQ